MHKLSITRTLLPGFCQGPALILDQPLSFWGGINPDDGTIIDVHHPQHGLCIKDSILFIPGIRGSTAAPGAFLETLFKGNAAQAIVLTEHDIATIIAATTFNFIAQSSLIIVECFEMEIAINTGQIVSIDTAKNSLVAC
jgi:predicted aconitase with swiveling domain